MKKIGFLLIFFIMLVGSVSASISIGDPSHSFQTSYGPAEFLKGWINMSFSSEPIDKVIRTNFGDSIVLKDLIQINSGIDYSCDPNGCGNTYATQDSGQTLKQFTLDKGESKIIGLKITGNYIQQISDFSMRISSNADESIYSPLYLDFFGDGTIEWQFNKASENFGNPNYGCFNPPFEYSAIITQREYCEKISIHETPKLKVGARVVKNPETTEPAEFKLSVSSEDGSNYDYCYATASSTGEISCDLNYFKVSEPKNVFACISAHNAEDERKYSISSETQAPCGYSDYYTGQYTRDFEIFIKPARYSALPNIIINNSELYNSGMYNYNIEDDMMNYIYNKYGGECSDGCIIPIKVISEYQKSTTSDTGTHIQGAQIANTEQTITLSDLDLFYSTDIETTANKFYELILTPAKITSDYILLDLNNSEFFVPEQIGNHTINLYYGTGTQAITSQEISIQEIPIIEQISPLKTAAGVSTKFTAILNDSQQNITSYEWDFGDNSSATSEINNVEHSYSQSGTYSLKVTAINEDGFKGFKTINLIVDSPKLAVKQKLNSGLDNLESLKQSFQNMPNFYKSSISDILDLKNIEEQLIDMNNTYNSFTNQTNDSKYISLMQSLLEINLPKSVKITSTSNPLLFYPSEDNINLEAIKEISGGEYNSRQEYIDAILFWNQNNLESRISFDKISADNGEYESFLLNIFKINTNRLSGDTSTIYYIIKDIENLKFEEDESINEISGYKYLPSNNGEETIQFSTTEEYTFVDIPVFISPAFSSLSIVKNSPINNITNTSSGFIVTLIVFILIVLYLGYSLFKKFKQKKSEMSIFKSKHDLDNLMEYISKMRKNGLNDMVIFNNLRRSKWKQNQIEYAMRKSKKRFGFSLPVEKIVRKLDRKR